MLDLKLKKKGKITIDKNGISCDGFDAKNAMCREVAILALIWGIGEMQRELSELIKKPGGTGAVSVD